MAFTLSAVDRVLAAYIIAGGAGTEDDVLPAKGSEPKEPPITICYCHSAKPLPEAPHSGILLVQAYIENRSSAIIQPAAASDQPRDDAEARVGATQELFRFTDDNSGEGLGTAITNARGAETLTIQSAKIEEITAGFNPFHPNRNLGNIWVDCIHLELVVTPGDTA